jgi:hypothetical protein
LPAMTRRPVVISFSFVSNCDGHAPGANGSTLGCDRGQRVVSPCRRSNTNSVSRRVQGRQTGLIGSTLHRRSE